MTRRRVIAAAILVEGALLLLAFGLGAALDAAPFGRARFGPGAVAIGVASGAVLLVVLLPAMRSDWPPFARLAETVRRLVREWFSDASTADLAVVSALAGVAEEALFRGVVQTALVGPWGTLPALLAAAALFGLAHAVSATYAVVAGAMGVFLGGLLAWTGDLAAPILAHAVYDFLALLWLVRVEKPAAPGEGGLSTPAGRTR